MPSLLSAHNLTFAYHNRHILTDVSFELVRGETVGLVGMNGSGKSTLLKLLLGILTPSSGSVVVDGRDLKQMKRREIARKISFVPQNSGIDFDFEAQEIVSMGRTPHLSRFSRFSRSDCEAVSEAMRLTGTTDLAGRLVTELSGGERQRIQIARAIAQQTDLMLLDEPTSNLDLSHQLEVLSIIRRLTDAGRAAIISIHDLSLAARYCDRIIVLSESRIVADGRPQEVFTENLLLKHFCVRARIYHDSSSLTILPISPSSHLEDLN